jgi:hypothetical protein
MYDNISLFYWRGCGTTAWKSCFLRLVCPTSSTCSSILVWSSPSLSSHTSGSTSPPCSRYRVYSPSHSSYTSGSSLPQCNRWTIFTLTFLMHLRFNFTSMQQVEYIHYSPSHSSYTSGSTLPQCNRYRIHSSHISVLTLPPYSGYRVLVYIHPHILEGRTSILDFYCYFISN